MMPLLKHSRHPPKIDGWGGGAERASVTPFGFRFAGRLCTYQLMVLSLEGLMKSNELRIPEIPTSHLREINDSCISRKQLIRHDSNTSTPGGHSHTARPNTHY